MNNDPLYWLPQWWGWIDQDWSRCQACLEYNHGTCISCEVPPGLLAIACLNGGGTTTVAGVMRGNVGIETAQQARAASLVSDRQAVNNQLRRQQQHRNILNINDSQNECNRHLRRL